MKEDIMANLKVFIIIIISIILIGNANAQFKPGNVEISLSGTGRFHNIGIHNITQISASVGLGYSVLSFLQIGIQPGWLYEKSKRKSETTFIDGRLNLRLFSKVNFNLGSKVVPFFVLQHEIQDVEDLDDNNIWDITYLNFGVGFRYFVCSGTAMNLLFLYHYPLKYAEYRIKTLDVVVGVSIVL